MKIGKAFLLAMLFVIGPVFACGPFTSVAVFSHLHRPDLPLTRYAAGELGIVQPTFARSYLTVAFLYFTNGKLTTEQQKQATKLWWHRLTDFGTPECDKAMAQWLSARKKLKPDAPAFDLYRHISEKEYTSYLNFLPDSFSTAAATLDSRLKSAKNDIHDPKIKDWLAAQDQVFGIGSQPGQDGDQNAIPEKIRGDADRDYQIACAHFYTQHFDVAEKEFIAIAANKNSPWHNLAPYMVARTLVRAATLVPSLNAPTDQISAKGRRDMTAYDCLKEAQSTAKNILASNEMSQYHDAAHELLGYIAARLDPTARAKELSEKLLSGHDSTFGQDLDDYTILLDRLSPPPDPDATTPTAWNRQSPALHTWHPADMSQLAGLSQPANTAPAAALLLASLLLLCLCIRSRASDLGSVSATEKIASRHWMNLFVLCLCLLPIVLCACEKPPSLSDRAPQTRKKRVESKFAVPDDELSTWILNYQLQTKDALEKTYSLWKSSHTDVWLVSTISKIDASDQRASEVMAAAARVPASSPAYVTLAFHRIRLLCASQKQSEAATILKSVLELPEAQLPPSARNLMMQQGLDLAHNMADFRKFAFLSPSSNVDESDLDAVPAADAAALKQLQSGDHFVNNPRRITRTAANVIDFALPLSLIKTLTSDASLAQPVKLDIAQAAWVRSVMLKKDDEEKALAKNLQDIRPQLGKGLTEYNAAATEAEKKFLFASIVLKNPAMRPYVTFGAPRETAFDTLDDYRNNWWSADGLNGSEEDATQKASLPAVNFLTEPEKKKAAEELASIKKEGTAPDYLAKLVIAWAEVQPHDPRLPESLYRATRATKVGNTDGNTTNLSKKMFQILHKNFPGNEWTKKTPYYY